MPPKTGRVKPAAKAAAGPKGAAGRDVKGAKSAAAASKNGPAKKGATAPAAAAKSNLVREVKPMTPAPTPALKEEAEPPEDPKHENPIYNEFDLDGHRIVSPEPTSKWGRLKKRARKAFHASALYQKNLQLKKRWRDYREKKRQRAHTQTLFKVPTPPRSARSIILYTFRRI